MSDATHPQWLIELPPDKQRRNVDHIVRTYEGILADYDAVIARLRHHPRRAAQLALLVEGRSGCLEKIAGYLALRQSIGGDE